jgi:hypothetical protein
VLGVSEAANGAGLAGGYSIDLSARPAVLSTSEAIAITPEVPLIKEG